MFFDTTLEKQLKDFVDTGCHIAIVKDIVEVEGADNEYKILGRVYTRTCTCVYVNVSAN